MHAITVVVTNFNYAPYLSRCLRSLIDQSLSKDAYEIILVDDNSNDDSRQIMDLFKEEVKIIQLEKNYGLSYCANVGIKNCRSRYFVRVDADDWVHKHFLETFLIGFELMGEMFEAISCDYINVNQIGEFISYGNQKFDPIACAIAFKTDIFEKLGYYDENLRINEEIDFMKRFLKADLNIFNVSLPLYRYVKHDKSLTGKTLI